jgi:hypothetical protein
VLNLALTHKKRITVRHTQVYKENVCTNAYGL